MSSSLTFLNGATMSLSHQLSLIAARRRFNVLSAFAVSIIPFNVMVRGTACFVTKKIRVPKELTHGPFAGESQLMLNA